VENPELKLRPGMTANVTFVYAEKDDALRVPNAALRFRPPPGMIPAAPGTSVTAPGDHGATAVPVPTGAPAAQPVRASTQAGPGPGGFAGGRRDARERSDRRTLWVLRDGKPSAVQIRIGISDGSTTEVREGALEPGDRVITDVSGLPGAGPPGGGMPGAMRRPF
jgi:HlyD family secretion protein